MAVYKQGNNWYVDFTFHGQRVKRMIGPSRKTASAVINKIKGEIAENKFLDIQKEQEKPELILFYEFAKEYLQWAKTNKKPSSYNRDLSLMRQVNREFEKMDIREISSWEIEKYKSRRKQESKRPEAAIGSFKRTGENGVKEEVWYVDYLNSQDQKIRKVFDCNKAGAEAFLERSKSSIRPASVNRELSLLKHMFTKAIEWGKLEKNPAKSVKLLKGEVTRVRFLVPEEIRTLLSNCADHLKPIVTVAVHTGMRRGELLKLKWEQVNFDQSIISLLDTKNHSRRDIPMDETVKATLSGIERKGPYVFCNGDGDTFGTIRRSFETALRKSGIRDFRFHDLRHTFASNLVMQEGVELNDVRELLGHKSMSMTLRYAHLSPKHKTRVVNILDRVMSLDPHTVESDKKVVSLNIGNH